LREVCEKIGKHQANDLYQEVFLIICEKDEEWIIEKYNSGYWEGLVIRIVVNQAYGQYTRFNKLFKQEPMLDSSKLEIPDHDVDYRKEILHYCIDIVLRDYDWYHTKIWKLYSEGGRNIKPKSARSISRATGISRHEIDKVINEIKYKANKQFKKYEPYI